MSEHECSGTDCASLVRIKALERTLEDEKKERSRSHEKIYNRLGALERGMTAVTTQYSQIIAQLATMKGGEAIMEKLVTAASLMMPSRCPMPPPMRH